MNLTRVTERIWTYPFERERDRPMLGYIRGDRMSIAVDAGHSKAHTLEFYAALRRAGLPLPSVTVLTHWHWDHTLGMHAVHGRCIASARTRERLIEFQAKFAQEGMPGFLALDETVRREYADPASGPVVITLPDEVFTGEMKLDAGGCPVRLLETASPHTDDCTLVVAEGEGVLFVGDAAGGVFPTWEKDAALCRELAQTIERLNVSLCLESHHTPQTKRELVDALRG